MLTVFKRPLTAPHNLSINFSRKFGEEGGGGSGGTDQTDGQTDSSHTPRQLEFNHDIRVKNLEWVRRVLSHIFRITIAHRSHMTLDMIVR